MTDFLCILFKIVISLNNYKTLNINEKKYQEESCSG